MKKRRLVLVLMLVLCTFAQSESQTALGEDSRDQSINHISAQQANDITQVEADVSDWWAKECVDCPKQVTNRSLWLNADGLPHIFYGCEQLHTASYDGADWQLASDDWLEHVGTCFDPVIDQWGYPHLVYFDELRGALMYAYKSASGWHLQMVEDNLGNVSATSLALDGQEHPHIIYSLSIDNLNDQLIYTFQEQEGWQSEKVGTTDGLIRYSSLTVDGGGNPHISYEVGGIEPITTGKLIYAVRQASEWDIQVAVIPSGGWDHPGLIGPITLVLDGNGAPRIGYLRRYEIIHRLNIAELHYVLQGPTSWQSELVSGYLPVETYTFSMVLDINGYPHFSYPDGDNLKYTTLIAGEWINTTIAQGSTENPSVVLDDNGFAHISYNEISQEVSSNVIQLKYIYQDENGWYEQTVDSGGGNVGQYTSLALDEMDNPHISYYDALTKNLKYAYKDGNTWHIQTVDSEGEVGLRTSLALDSNGNPHISYTENNYCDDGGYGGPYVCGSFIKYTYQDEQGWHTQTIDLGYTDYVAPSLALDAMGYPYLCYEVDYSELGYANLDASGWHTQTVVIGEGIVRSPSLKLDKDGYAHISYINEDSLYYTFQDAGGWNIQIVDSEGMYGGGETSLALSEEDTPHISYSSGYPNYFMKYAYQKDGVWQTQTIDQYEPGWIATTLDLDREDQPHISYIGEVEINELRYANLDSSSWHTKTLDTGYPWHASTSLTLDQDSLPHISYKKGSNLMYTYNKGAYQATYLPLVMK